MKRHGEILHILASYTYGMKWYVLYGIWHGILCHAMLFYAILCYVVWCGVVWYGVVWCGVVWCGMVWYGMVWYGMVWYGMVWYGMVWYGMVWYGMVWYGKITIYLSKVLFHTYPSYGNYEVLLNCYCRDTGVVRLYILVLHYKLSVPNDILHLKKMIKTFETSRFECFATVV